MGPGYSALPAAGECAGAGASTALAALLATAASCALELVVKRCRLRLLLSKLLRLKGWEPLRPMRCRATLGWAPSPTCDIAQGDADCFRLVPALQIDRVHEGHACPHFPEAESTFFAESLVQRVKGKLSPIKLQPRSFA